MKKTSPNQTTSTKKRPGKIARRDFVKILPATVAASLAAPAALASARDAAPQQPPPPPPPQRITKEMLHTAEQLIGIELTDAQEAMALQNVNNNLASYETLRQIEVPLDTDPAIWFHPALPGKTPRRKKSPSNQAKSPHAKITVPKFGALEEVAFFTATQLSELIRTRQVAPVELTKMYLARLKRYAPKLLNVVTLTEELALAQAEQAEREIKQGNYRGPLHGVPCGVKDLFATKGIKTTWGAEPYRNQMIDYDATVVERLRQAGAVLLAKLSMGALAQGGRWFNGMTRNPWQVEEDRLGSSGSSAGSASATAAGLVGFSIGTETLGSIVSPSSRCGVTGLRPTYGRVSRYGAMGLSWTMDKIGPICRSVEDCAMVLEAIYGPDERDLTVTDAPFQYDANRPLAKLRIGYLKSEFEADNPNNTAERKALYQQALDDLRKAGAHLQPLELPKFSTGSLRIILVAEAATAFDDITRDGRVNELSGQAPGDWPNTFRSSRFIPAVEYLRAQRARTLLMREMDKLMSAWDVFVSPAPGSASLLITNLTGHPAVVTPCGFINNLPQAIMFTGGLYDEGAPLRVASAYQQATSWHTMHPKMDWA
ncbi:MAG: amidase [Acidobacteria bacterium]|nr:amidase [Acidobacteriota bacterium]